MRYLCNLKTSSISKFHFKASFINVTRLNCAPEGSFLVWFHALTKQTTVVWWLESRSLNHKDTSLNPPTDLDSECLAKTLKAQSYSKRGKTLACASNVYIVPFVIMYHV